MQPGLLEKIVAVGGMDGDALQVAVARGGQRNLAAGGNDQSCAASAFGGRARQTKEHHDRPVQPQDVLIVEASDARAHLRFGHCGDLVDHEAARRPQPFLARGSIRRRNSGAPVGSVVKAQTVIDAVASKRSSRRMTTGRGLPA
jgi:hypothetical protein